MLIVPSSRNALPLGRWISTGAILPPKGYLTMSRGISGFRDLVQRWGGEGGGGGSSSPRRARDAPTAKSYPAPTSTVPRQGNSAPGLSSTHSSSAPGLSSTHSSSAPGLSSTHSSFRPLLKGHLFSEALQTILQKRGTSRHPRPHHTASLSSWPPHHCLKSSCLFIFT